MNKALGLLIITLGFKNGYTKEEIETAADQLDLTGYTWEQIESMVSEQIKLNRSKKALQNTIAKAVKGMPIVYIFMVIGAVYMAGGH
jgi:hypothetical protein